MDTKFNIRKFQRVERENKKVKVDQMYRTINNLPQRHKQYCHYCGKKLTPKSDLQYSCHKTCHTQWVDECEYGHRLFYSVYTGCLLPNNVFENEDGTFRYSVVCKCYRGLINPMTIPYCNKCVKDLSYII